MNPTPAMPTPPRLYLHRPTRDRATMLPTHDLYRHLTHQAYGWALENDRTSPLDIDHGPTYATALLRPRCECLVPMCEHPFTTDAWYDLYWAHQMPDVQSHYTDEPPWHETTGWSLIGDPITSWPGANVQGSPLGQSLLAQDILAKVITLTAPKLTTYQRALQGQARLERAQDEMDDAQRSWCDLWTNMRAQDPDQVPYHVSDGIARYQHEKARQRRILAGLPAEL